MTPFDMPYMQYAQNMHIAFILAKILGLYFILYALAIIVNTDRQKKVMKELMKSYSSLYVIGTLILVMGLAIVALHNVWLPNWTLLITIIGWSMVAKGSLILILPDEMIKLSKQSMKDNTQLIGAILGLVLGLYLTFMGYLG